MMVKVIHSEVQCEHGGVESFLMNIASKVSDNVKIEFLMRGDNIGIESNLRGKIHKIPLSRVQYIGYIRQLFKENKYDIVHIHKNSAADVMLPVLAKIFSRKSKVIIHSHNTQPSTSSKAKVFLHYINRGLLSVIAEKKLACSDLAAKWLFGESTYKAGNVTLIKNGIDTDRYAYNPIVRKSIRGSYSLDEKTIVIGNIGRMSKQKNQSFLIDILAEMIKKYDVKLLICGDGPCREEICAKAKELGVSDRLILPGACDNIPAMLQAMDVFVMPSLYEGLTIAAVEAQCAGLQCLFTDNFSRETVCTKNCRFLSLQDSPHTWAEAICCVLNKQRMNIAEDVSKAGFDNVSSAVKLEEIYYQMCGKS